MNNEKLEEIKQLMGEQFQALIDVYISDNQSRLKEIEANIQLANFKQIKLLSHSMKSSSANIGADEIAMLAASIEQYAIQESIDNIHGLMPMLKKAIDEVIQILNN
jgi:HPt (histidine-containing phosphotransfer) domain-containing protein